MYAPDLHPPTTRHDQTRSGTSPKRPNTQAPRMEMARSAMIYRLGGDAYAVWNRYFPEPHWLDGAALRFLQSVAERGEFSPGERKFLRVLTRARLVHEPGDDPFLDAFLEEVSGFLARVDALEVEARRQAMPYSALHLVNNRCNLACPYCIARLASDDRETAADAKRGKESHHEVIAVVRRFLDDRVAAGHSSATISLNGGESLVSWPLVKSVLSCATEYQPRLRVTWFLNTNGTLVSEEVARVLQRHRVRVSVSIDGYKEAHDKTRVYHRQEGSFDDVLRAVRIYNKSGRRRLKGFQGTIADASRFAPHRLFAMSRHGFSTARLAPNLMGATAEQGRDFADLEASLYRFGQNRKLRVETLYSGLVRRVGKPRGLWSLPCVGLSGFPSRILTLHVDSMRLGRLCAFVPSATVPLRSINGDIYHPEVWGATRRAIDARLRVLCTECLDCPVIGSCLGGCILNGLDFAQRVNNGACSYQMRLWEHALRECYASENLSS